LGLYRGRGLVIVLRVEFEASWLLDDFDLGSLLPCFPIAHNEPLLALLALMSLYRLNLKLLMDVFKLILIWLDLMLTTKRKGLFRS
jgi:hypothetical protein